MWASIKGMTASTGLAMIRAIKLRHVPADMDMYVPSIFVGIFFLTVEESKKDGDDLGQHSFGTELM